MTIPTTLAPFFQEYDLAVLDPQSAAPLIFERTLQYGDRKELHWLFSQYPRQQIRDWVREFGKERLPHPHLDFWQIVLEIESWGNLVYLAWDVRIGFYGYGFEMVTPLVEMQEARLASLEDIALMKLDALLARAARKDFYDLYFICQKIPLRKILDLAPENIPPCVISKPRLSNAWFTSKTPKQTPTQNSFYP